MPRLWTLRSPVKGGCKEVLNGKIFLITKCINGEDEEAARFIDATNNNIIWETSKVIKIKDTGDYLSIVTKDDIFNFISIESMIPTATSELSATLIYEARQPVRRGYIINGYDVFIYKFNRAISKDEFTEWCMSNGHPIIPKIIIGEDYSEVYGNGDTWTYKWIRVYKY